MALTSNAVLNRAAFPQALASRTRRLGSDETIQQLIEQAEAKSLAGGGEVAFLTNASGNGKTAMQECRIDATDQALSLYAAMVAAGTSGTGAAVSAPTPTSRAFPADAMGFFGKLKSAVAGAVVGFRMSSEPYSEATNWPADRSNVMDLASADRVRTQPAKAPTRAAGRAGFSR